MRRGIVEGFQTLRYGARAGTPVNGFARDLATWTRVFLHPSEIAGGHLPPIYTRIEFEIDETSDERGPRAVNVRVLGEPSKVIARECSECRTSFAISPGEQAWFIDFKQLRLPTRCRACREARQSAHR